MTPLRRPACGDVFWTFKVFHFRRPSRGAASEETERMNCPTCFGIGEVLIGKDGLPASRLRDAATMIPCPECGGCGTTHCCEGDVVAGIGRVAGEGLTEQAGPVHNRKLSPCRSNTMPNTVIIFRDPGIGSRTGRSTRQH